jgi:hypothetical protein
MISQFFRDSVGNTAVTEPPKRDVGAWIGKQPELFPSIDEQLDPLTAKGLPHVWGCDV